MTNKPRALGESRLPTLGRGESAVDPGVPGMLGSSALDPFQEGKLRVPTSRLLRGDQRQSRQAYATR